MERGDILMTGASGLVGKSLRRHLESMGYRIIALTTGPSQPDRLIFHWDPVKGEWDDFPARDLKAVIHLAGANIVDTPWTKKGRETLISSRTRSASTLREILEQKKVRVEHSISASATGFYGNHSENILVENDPAGPDFPAFICKNWEKAADGLLGVSEKLSILRIGIVMAKDGGFYGRMAGFAKYMAAVILGSGKQNINWIHIDDLTAIFSSILKNEIPTGIYNAVGGNSSHSEVVKKIAAVNGQKLVPFHLPSFLLKIGMGEKADMLLDGVIVSNEKLTRAGFVFRHPILDEAVDHLSKPE